MRKFIQQVIGIYRVSQISYALLDKLSHLWHQPNILYFHILISVCQILHISMVARC